MIESKKKAREIFSKKNYFFLIIFFSSTIIFSQNTTGLIQKKKKILEEIEITSQILQSAKKQKKLSIQSLRALTLNITLRTELKETIIQQKDSIEFYKKEIESEIQTTERERKNLIEKASIAINGISLTISKKTKKGFQVWVIPHTFKITNLSKTKKKDLVNIEIDILSKYVRNYFNEK